jgi:hypothetical protein
MAIKFHKMHTGDLGIRVIAAICANGLAQKT